MIFRWSSFFLVAITLAVAPAHAASKKKSAEKTPASAYKGAITIDAQTGQTLFEDNADVISPPASVTKLMTFFVVADRIKAGAIALDTPVKITPEDAKIGGTQVWLDPKETIKVDDLLYAMMIRSANDAANALARASAGSREAFVALMNEKAKALGMTHTTFRSPHGLPPKDRKLDDSDLTTPRDLAILSRALIQQTDILKYTSVKRRAFREDPSDQVMMDSHNHLLGKVKGCDGLKTGYTVPAGYCISATAERDGRRVITVVMGSQSYQARDVRAIELIEQGFIALAKIQPTAPVASSASPIAPVAGKSANTAASPVASPIAPATSAPTAPAPVTTHSTQSADTPAVTFPGAIPPKKR